MTFTLSAELEAYAPLVEKAFGEVLAQASRAPGARGTWGRAALAAVTNALAPMRRPKWDTDLYDEYCDDEARDRTEANERVGRALLAHTNDTASVGETTTSKLAWALVYASMDASILGLLRAAFGLPSETRGVDAERYASVLAPVVTSKEMFAPYLAGLFGAGAVDGEELASAIFPASRRAGLFPELSEEDMVARLDAWLYKRAPSSNPRAAAKQALVALGLSSKEAAGLAAMAALPLVTKAATTAAVSLPELPTLKKRKARSSKSPWLRRMANKPEADVRAELARRWAGAPRWLVPLRSRLLSSSIRGTKGEFLELHHERDERSYWIAPPVSKSAARRTLRALGVPPTHPLVDLVLFFDGLRETPPDDAGALVQVANMKNVTAARRGRSDVAWVLQGVSLEDLADFRDAVVVYQTPGADLLVASPRGPIAWARHGSGELEPAGSTLRAFKLGIAVY